MIIEIILLVLAFPAGFLIAWMARDELIDGKKWFRALVIASLALGALFWMLGFSYVSLTLGFIAIVSFVSLLKSSDKKWTKKRI
jgi:ABC-type Fe3+ transport system permease subunit